MKVHPSILIALALIVVAGLAPADAPKSDKIVAKEIILASEDGKVEIVLKAGKDRVDLRIGSTADSLSQHVSITAGGGRSYLNGRREVVMDAPPGRGDSGMPHVHALVGADGGYANLAELLKRRR